MIKLGIQSAILGDLSFDELITFASENGFACVEVMCWPASYENRKYAGVSHLDVDKLDDIEISRIKRLLDQKNVTISGLGYYPNPLDPDFEKSQFYFNHIRKVIDAAVRLGTGIVNTFIGADPARHDEENFKKFLELWPPVVRYAEERNIKLGIENCPMFMTKEDWPSGKNLAHAPALWRKIFGAIPSANFGLNYDPSHLVWQMIDYVKPVHEFRDRIFHVHLKDARVTWEKINETGVLTTPENLHEPKLPGLGDINWGKFISALYESGYKGAACIEVEDRSFEESLDTRKKSLLLSRNYLRQFIVE